MQLKENFAWIKGYNINYHLGVDGISILMILLTTLLTLVCFLISFDSIKNRVKEYSCYFLLLESFMLGCFAANDAILFYIFFEATLIPMYFIIGIWGGEKRIYATIKFFLYTLAGSVLFLVGILYLYNVTGTADISTIQAIAPEIISLKAQKWLWLGLFASFAVKIPMFPFHTWLPDAHVQAPTAGSIILAGILIKLGAYGFIRFSLPMLPEASVYFSKFVLILSVIAIIYASIVALAQQDMKKMIAYSSIAHMGYVTMGIFSFNQMAIEGAVMQMISHGLISGALFLSVGVIYNRIHTKKIIDMGGIINKAPNFAFIFMVLTLASIGLPGTSGFVGEFLTIVGAFKYSKVTAIFAATGVILGACYMLWLYARIIFGDIKNKKIESFSDINLSETISLFFLGMIIIVIGVYPTLILNYLKHPILELVNIF